MSAESLSPTRRDLLAASAAAGAVSVLPAQMASGAGGENAIRPFRINIPEAELTELRRRINATKWPERETVADASQGVQLATIQKLAQYWASSHDWRKCEAKINAVPNFITEIDGLDIHFIHVRSKHENALPMIVTHGWPGSIIEQMKIIEPLTNPTAHGGTAADAFDLVIPSLPGYGFSGKPTAPGWNPVSIAKAWATLMQRLGYTQYVAQGGDWGECHLRGDGIAAAAGIARHSHQHGGDGSARCFEGAFRGRPAARRPVRRRKSSRGMGSMTSIRMGSATPTRWRFVRRRSTESSIRRLVSRAGYSITTFAATR